jgi:alginate O-acetyltransferase complex protein AlgI
MLFNSYPFLFLVLLTFFIYYLPVFTKIQVYILIAASFVFYAYHAPYLLFLLIISILFNSIISWSISIELSKKIVVLGVVFNLLLLFFFKYSSLFFSVFLEIKTDNLLYYLINLPLPIGISFYTFEGISLVVDTFRGTKKTSHSNKSLYNHIVETTHFVSFFPHLIAGPILKAHVFYPQIKPKFFNKIDWYNVYRNLVIGFFLKMVVADNLKEFTNYIAYPYFTNLPSLTLAFLLFGYSIQIFADFAGYSLIAIGLGRLFGYDLPQNFNFPYISKSFAEFWQRWHISLSTWLKEYLYIPLGGNRYGSFRTYLNLFLVMFLGGLWHGAGWNYAVWGMVHGGALVIERLFKNDNKTKSNFIFKTIKTLIVFAVVTIAWLFFKLPNFGHSLLFLKHLFSNSNIPFILGIREVCLSIFSIPVIAYHLLFLFNFRLSSKLDGLILSVLLFLIFVNSGFQGDFIYFQF